MKILFDNFCTSKQRTAITQPSHRCTRRQNVNGTDLVASIQLSIKRGVSKCPNLKRILAVVCYLNKRIKTKAAFDSVLSLGSAALCRSAEKGNFGACWNICYIFKWLCGDSLQGISLVSVLSGDASINLASNAGKLVSLNIRMLRVCLWSWLMLSRNKSRPISWFSI